MILSDDTQPSREGPYEHSHQPSDIQAGFEITDQFERFNACNDVFARAQWDHRIRSTKALRWFYSMLGYDLPIKNKEGYTQKDFALRNAGWVVANLMMERSAQLGRHDGFLDDIREYRKPTAKKVEITSPTDMAAEIKQAGKVFGADMVGITATDWRWHYTHRFDATDRAEKEYEMPKELVNCIVIGTSMHYEVVKTYPSALAGLAPAFGYSKDAVILQSLAQFIRNMGYQAVATLNDTAQAIPYAVQAGLAEYGRNGLAITKDFGPRVRFGKIFTDMPLSHDTPVKFGVKEFCEICTKCADACPAKAIAYGAPSDNVHNQSNIKGVRKWTVDGEKCFNVWANQGTECGICIRVCPYNKSNATWRSRNYFRLFRWMAASPLKRVALWLDGKLSFGKRMPASWWWQTRPEK